MALEEQIINEIKDKFPYLSGKMVQKRIRRIDALVPLENFAEVFSYLHDNLSFNELSAITGLDEANNFAVIYHLVKGGSIVLSLKVQLPKENPEIKTVTKCFPAADAYERELVDLLGINVVGLPQGHRYPLPDNWPASSYPLRKDWKEIQKEGA